MASYLVLTPPDGDARDEAAIFVRDGFSLLALLVPLVYLLWHRLWLWAGMFILGWLLAAVVGAMTGFSALPGIFLICSAVYLAVEGNNLRSASLQRAGWDLRAAIGAVRLADAEDAFYADQEKADEKPPRPSARVDWNAIKARNPAPERSSSTSWADPWGGR